MKINEMPKAAILKACYEIQSKDHNQSNGICDSSENYLLDLIEENYPDSSDETFYGLQDKVASILSGCFKSWPLFSGDDLYPIPHPTKTPRDGYNTSPNHETMYQGVYGTNRINLANFIIYTLTKED